MRIATAPVGELVAATGCTKIEALQEKRLAAIAGLPYLHQKQPVAIDVTNRNVVHLHITDALFTDDGDADGGDDEGTISLTATLVEKLDGPDAQPRLESAGSSGGALHALNEADANSKRPDRVG